MRQFLALGAGVLLFPIFGTAFLGCGGGATVGPAIRVNLSPTAVSLNRGATAQITAQALSADNVTVSTPPLSYSSDSSVITVSNSGLICAGQWDANFINCQPCSNPAASSQCTAGNANALPLGTAHITAAATVNGQTIISSAVVVTDHDRIDRLKVCAAGSSAGNCITPPSGVCVSQTSTAQFTAQAFSNDPTACQRITGSNSTPCQIPADEIGAVNWAVSPPQVGTADATIKAAIDPVMVTAATPGEGAVVGSVGVAGSLASGSATFTTCPVASIHIQKSSSDSGTSFTAPVGSTVTLTPVVLDSNNHSLSSTVALSWFTSQPALASVSLGTVGTVAPGTAEITAACLPPSCNVNFVPPQPVFSDNVVTATISGAVDSTVLVTTSTGPSCTANTACSNSDLIVPIDTTTNSPGTAFTLPAGLQVNSMALTSAGNPAFLGTSCSGAGVTGPSGTVCSGLLRFDPTVATVASPVPTITGTVLATDGNRVVVADPNNNQTFIALAAGPSIEATLSQIPNATAAAFAIDGSKIYIVAGSQLFIYSPGLPLRTLSPPLSGTPSASSQAVSFFATGATAYVADSAGDDVIAACQDAIQGPAVGFAGPTHIAAVPNGSMAPLGTAIPAMVDANNPNIDELDVDASSTSGCPFTFTSPASSHSFPNVASFTAKQLIVTPDSKLALILTSDQGVLVYDLTSKTPMSPVTLSGGAQAIRGGVTPDGASLYVGATDGKVHRVDLTKTPPTDAQSIAVNLCPSVAAGCTPDFVVVRPVATATTLSSIAVTPANPKVTVGGTQQFTATGTFSDKTTRDMTNFVTWASSNTNVAVIGPTTSVNPPITVPGLAQALATGTSTITASSAGVSGSTTLTVQ